jgi:hypothetical protein
MRTRPISFWLEVWTSANLILRDLMLTLIQEQIIKTVSLRSFIKHHNASLRLSGDLRILEFCLKKEAQNFSGKKIESGISAEKFSSLMSSLVSETGAAQLIVEYIPLSMIATVLKGLPSDTRGAIMRQLHSDSS